MLLCPGELTKCSVFWRAPRRVCKGPKGAISAVPLCTEELLNKLYTVSNVYTKLSRIELVRKMQTNITRKIKVDVSSWIWSASYQEA